MYCLTNKKPLSISFDDFPVNHGFLILGFYKPATCAVSLLRPLSGVWCLIASGIETGLSKVFFQNPGVSSLIMNNYHLVLFFELLICLQLLVDNFKNEKEAI